MDQKSISISSRRSNPAFLSLRGAQRRNNLPNPRQTLRFIKHLLKLLLFLLCFPPPSYTQAQDQPANPEFTVSLPALTDARITQVWSTSSCGDESYLAAGYDRLGNPNQGVVRSLLKFDLTRLPQGAVVSQAALNLYYVDFSGPLAGTYTLGVAPVLGAWAENSVQWSTAPPIIASALITATVNHDQNPKQYPYWISFDITGLVQSWLQGAQPNYGLELFGMDETPSELSSVEFFESTEFVSEEPLHKPYISVTYTVPLAGPPSIDGPPWSAYLPLLLNAYPPVLDLHPIDNDGGEGNYTITWSPHPKGANQYELLEWIGGQWQVIFKSFIGESSFKVVDKPLGTYSYFLKATGDGWTENSLVRSVTVSDSPNRMVYLVVGVGDYLNMPSIYTQDAKLGNDLRYPLFDATDVQDMLEAYSFVEGQPSEHVLTLKDRQATKVAIQNAITGWLDAREAANTTIFVYFSGHTLLQGSKPYLAPYDLACGPCTNPSMNSTWLAASAISAQEINTWLGELASSQVLFVFDSAESERWINELAGPGRQILAGSSTVERRWEFVEIKNGAFSWYLNEAYVKNADLDQDDGISLAEVAAFTTTPPTMYKFVYDHTTNVDGGPYQQHAVLDADPLGQVDFMHVILPQACQPLR